MLRTFPCVLPRKGTIGFRGPWHEPSSGPDTPGTCCPTLVRSHYGYRPDSVGSDVEAVRRRNCGSSGRVGRRGQTASLDCACACPPIRASSPRRRSHRALGRGRHHRPGRVPARRTGGRLRRPGGLTSAARSRCGHRLAAAGAQRPGIGRHLLARPRGRPSPPAFDRGAVGADVRRRNPAAAALARGRLSRGCWRCSPPACSPAWV